MNSGDKQVLSEIEKYGWHVVQVLEDEEGPAFAFSIGLFHTLKHPEVIIFGLPLEIAHQLINNMGQAVKSGQNYLPGHEYDDILEGYNCSFIEVDIEWYSEYLGYATWFYKGQNFPVVQCVWPDKQQRYPWEAEANKHLQELQPLLSK
jgi:hypothetical protein